MNRQNSRPSYVQASDEPLVGATIGEMFDAMALTNAAREALVVPHQNVRWTYAELKRRVDEVALGLMRLGLEKFLYRHPKVQDVQCIGVPDAKYGEELCACLILRPGEQATEHEIRDFCAGQIARFKIPRYVRFVTGFPMTVTGKVAKYLLREQIARELNVRDVEAA